jgi:uncharacterized membrane protein
VIDQVLFVLIFLLALGCGLVAGIFFAFSAFVMKALARIPSAQGIAAMQSINITVINPWFLSVFMGAAVVSALIFVTSFWRWSEPQSAYLLGGALTYFIGTFLVTIVFNIPRNNALAAVDPTSISGDSLWGQYLTSWTLWNHVRTVAALAASALFILALLS